jgi:hypothetical protein
MAKLIKIMPPDTVNIFYKKCAKLEVRRKIQPVIQDMVRHFKKHKWPLSVSHIKSELILALTGMEGLAIIYTELRKHNVHVGFGEKDDEFVLYLEEIKVESKKKKSRRKSR